MNEVSKKPKEEQKDELLIFGGNDLEQFPIDKHYISSPIRLNFNFRIRKIACGAYYIALLSKDHRVFIYGDQETDATSQRNLTQINLNIEPTDINSGDSFVVAYNDKKILLWGSFRVSIFFNNLLIRIQKILPLFKHPLK